MTAPPFRAEHIGSLLRPENLLKARAALEGDQYRKVAGSVSYGVRRRCCISGAGAR